MAYYYALACHSPEMRATVGVNTVTAIFDRKLALTARRKFIALTRTHPCAGQAIAVILFLPFLFYIPAPPSACSVRF